MTTSFTIGSLFSGIGGLELGLEMGLGNARTLWQVEMDPYARAVLKKHWPDTLRLEDVRNVTADIVPGVDLICGGFPCQPHSVAGQRQSSLDERDLWHEFARIIGEVRPRWVVAENVPGLRSSADPAYGRGRGGFFGRVLRDLAEIGFDAEWHSFAAADVGAHHRRERVFIVAYAVRPGRQEQHASTLTAGPGQRAWGGDAPAWAGGGWKQPSPATEWEEETHSEVERGIRYLADGISARVDRLRCLGNAVVPQAAEVIGRAIKDAERHYAMTGHLPEQVVRPEHLRGTYAHSAD